MKYNEKVVLTVTCESDPCEEKTQFKIKAPNFREIEEANDCAGGVTAYGLSVAKKQADFEEQIKNKKIPKDSILDLNDEEQKAIYRLSKWVRDRNTAIVLKCLVGADDLIFNDYKEVEQYLLNISPANCVRDVIDELATKIFDLSSSLKKKND